MSDSLKNHFLIAMPGLADSLFAHSITYLCEHGDQGAMGIVINRPLDLCYSDIFEHLEIEGHDTNDNRPVLSGGPVQTDRGFVLHRRSSHWNWQSTLHVTSAISVTTSRDILDAVALREGPSEAIIALGYAGWSSGQLEQELASNAWLTVTAEPDIIFELPLEQRAQAAARLLGINLDLLSSTTGHA